MTASSLVAAVQAQAAGLQGRTRAPELDSAHLPAPRPLYICQWTLKDECPLSVFFTLFGCWSGGGGLPIDFATTSLIDCLRLPH